MACAGTGFLDLDMALSDMREVSFVYCRVVLPAGGKEALCNSVNHSSKHCFVIAKGGLVVMNIGFAKRLDFSSSP